MNMGGSYLLASKAYVWIEQFYKNNKYVSSFPEALTNIDFLRLIKTKINSQTQKRKYQSWK